MKLTKFIYKSGYVAIAGLALLALAFTITLPSVSAITAGSEVTVNIPTILSLTLDNGDSTTTDNDVLFNVTASDMGTLLTKNLAITAQTNNATGYTLTFNDTDADNNLTHTINNTYTVPSVTANTAPASFPDNKWGYLYASGTITDTTNPNNSTNTNYHPVPLLSAPGALETTTSPSQNTTNMTFATKITEATPAGTYQDNLVFTLVANYVPVTPAFWTATTMQEFSQTTCDSVDTPAAAATTVVTSSAAYTDKNTQVPQTTLQDTRDNKYYIIRKLADGNCWMAQNLDLEAAGKTLTDQDTDLNSKTSWNGAVQVNLGATWTQPDYTTARYYSASNTQTGDTYWTNGGTDMTVNPGIQTTWTGSFPNNPNPTPAYLMGNYYTWPAATAGGVDDSYSETSKEAPDSICPKGWRLPLNEGNKSWYNLLTTTYGITNDATGSEKVLKDPLTFVRSGHYGYLNGQLYHQGTTGRWWSAVAYPSYAGYAQNFYTLQGYVYPQDANNVSPAWSVRCVTR